MFWKWMGIVYSSRVHQNNRLILLKWKSHNRMHTTSSSSVVEASKNFLHVPLLQKMGEKKGVIFLSVSSHYLVPIHSINWPCHANSENIIRQNSKSMQFGLIALCHTTTTMDCQNKKKWMKKNSIPLPSLEVRKSETKKMSKRKSCLQ